MNEQEQRIAIATAVGWSRFHHDGPGGDWLGRPPTARQDEDESEVLPDFLNDLNAMHEAEKVLRKRPAKWREYRKRLNWLPDYGVCATAPQRAEAFLRTLSLWKE